MRIALAALTSLAFTICSAGALRPAAAAAAASTCAPANAQYRTTFRQPDDAWETIDGSGIANGAMHFAPPAGRTNTVFYQGDTFHDGEICLDATMTSTVGREPRVGIAFWETAPKNYYFFIYDPTTHRAATFREKAGKVSIVVDWRKLPGLDGGIHAVAHMTVKTDGSRATMAVDGVPAGTFRGRQVDGPWHAGIRTEAGDEHASTFVISDYSVGG